MSNDTYIPFYGDVTELNTERTILDAVGKEALNDLTSDLMDLLQTSIAIYQKNGDYAYGEFDSAWCQCMDASSRKLCNTDNNKKALNCGKWLCHEDCWNNSAKAAMETKRSTDIDCIGGIKLYGEPIFAGEDIIGAINIGYGNPPTDDKSLHQLAEKYQIDFDTLKQKALAYELRPEYIIKAAKKRLKSTARLIGEIVSRKQVERALKESEERLKLITNQSPFPVAVVSTDKEKIIYWSERAEELTGYSPKTLSEWYDVAYPEKEYQKQVIECWKPYEEEARKTGKCINAGEYKITCKDGSLKSCELYAQFIPGNLVVTFNDVTARKDSERALKESEKKFRTIFNMSLGLMAISDLNTSTFKVINPAFTRTLGYSEEELLSSPFLDFIHPDDLESTIQVIEKELQAGKKVLHFQNRYKHKDGYYRWLDWNTYPLPDEGISYAIAHDISEHKKSEQELNSKNGELLKAKKEIEKSEIKYRSYIDHSPLGVFILNRNGELVDINPGACKLLGYKEKELIKLSITDISTIKDDTHNYLPKKRTETIHYETQLSKKDGSSVYVKWDAVSLPEDLFLAFCTDITEIKKAEAEIQKAKDLSEKYLHVAGSMIIVLNPVGEIILLNKKGHEILGYDIGELYGKEWFSTCLPADISADTKAYFDKLMKDEIECVTHHENEITRKDGSKRIIKWNNTLLKEDSGTITGLLSSGEDVTQQRIAEEKLRKSEERFNLAINATKDGIFDWNLETNSIYYSPQWKKMLGYNDEELPNDFSVWETLIDPEDAKASWKMQQDLINRKIDNFQLEFRMMHKEGYWVDILSRASALFDRNGKAVRIVGTHTDITARKKARQEILENRKEFQTWIQNVPVCTKKIDLDFNLQFMSEAGIRELKVKNVNDLYGAPYPFDFFPPESQDQMRAVMKQVKETGEMRTIDGILSDTEGKRMWYNHILVPVNNTEGKLDYFLIISTDISGRKKAEEQLIKAKEKAEESDRLKTEFLNNMSHEIRTPMNGIIGFTDMLNEPDISLEKRSYYSRIVQNCSYQLLRIIDDILEISTLGVKQGQINETEFCLNDLLMELFSIFSLKSKERNIPIYIKKALPDEKSYVISDKVKLNKILSNLLENAIKYTDEGSIELGYYVENKNLVIYVKDSGIGIAPENHKKVFDRFAQEDKDTTRIHGGLGLGLSICKENAKLLGGEIILESEKGKGSVFYVSLPYRSFKSDKETKSSDSIENKKGYNEYTLLIAEDEVVNFLYLEILFQDTRDVHYHILHARNGLEAVDICKENNKIDLVLMDIKMPVMNGHKAAKMIKEISPNLPIIAQTAYSTESDHQLALSHGCDDFISKPIRKELLLDLVSKYLNREM